MRPPVAMAFINRVLDPPSYGWESKPDAKQLLRECLSRCNIFASRKNWLPFTNWFWTMGLAPFVAIFFAKYFSFPLLVVGFLYGMVLMGSYGTIWLHRYGTHRAYTFSHPIFRFITRNLVIKVVPEEIYIISHQVHHVRSEQTGDPYNAKRGGLYCFLADTNHQPIAKDLSEQDYAKATKLVRHTGMRLNSYAEYQRWGSIADPLRTTVHFALNWAFWYAAFWLLGGHALACAIFGGAHIWAVGIRTFNFAGHGNGEDRRKPGIDFCQTDHSINQIWPGYVAGEWHNNHHLYAGSARTGFLPWQIDIPWYYIRALAAIGAVNWYRDKKPDFLRDHYLPYLEQTKSAAERVLDEHQAETSARS